MKRIVLVMLTVMAVATVPAALLGNDGGVCTFPCLGACSVEAHETQSATTLPRDAAMTVTARAMPSSTS